MISRRLAAVLLAAFIAVLICVAIGADLYLRAMVHECAKKPVDNNRREECYRSLIARGADLAGAKGGMWVIALLYTDPEFGTTGCYRYAQQVGRLAYDEMIRRGDPIKAYDFPEETGWCSAGFFHEFIARYAEDHSDPSDLSGLCRALEPRMARATGDAARTCAMAIGHGLERASASQAFAGGKASPHEVTSGAFAACKAVSDGSEFADACKNGAMEEYSYLAQGGKYGLRFDPSRPFDLCAPFAGADSPACYWAASQLLARSAGDDVSELENMSAHLAPRVRASVFEMGIAMMMNDIGRSAPSHRIFSDCLRLAKDEQALCVGGVVRGLFLNGSPGSEYVPAIEFCTAADVTDANLRLRCFSALAEWMRKMYPNEKAQNVCTNEFPVDQHATCTSY